MDTLTGWEVGIKELEDADWDDEEEVERSPRESMEAMLRIETGNLNWQRANDQGYSAITGTMERIWELNERIAATVGNRPSAYQTSYR